MLASRRFLRIGNAPSIKTPLLLPSFSSKGFPNVSKILQTMEEYISEEVLVSAYDIHHGHVRPPFDFASAIFLDSGGYEASEETELSDTHERAHTGGEWSFEKHQRVLSDWKSNSPTVCVSYDHPSERMATKDQIVRAKAIVLPPGNSARALLIKPETKDSKRLHLENILSTVKQMTGFAVIGVTEKEIGNSTLSRMINVAITPAFQFTSSEASIQSQLFYIFSRGQTFSTVSLGSATRFQTATLSIGITLGR